MSYCLNKGYGSGGYVPPGVESVSRSRTAGADAPDLVENIVFSKGEEQAVVPIICSAIGSSYLASWTIYSVPF